MTTGPREENGCPLPSSLSNFQLLQQLNEYSRSARSAWRFLFSQGLHCGPLSVPAPLCLALEKPVRTGMSTGPALGAAEIL